MAKERVRREALTPDTVSLETVSLDPVKSEPVIQEPVTAEPDTAERDAPEPVNSVPVNNDALPADFVGHDTQHLTAVCSTLGMPPDVFKGDQPASESVASEAIASEASEDLEVAALVGPVDSASVSADPVRESTIIPVELPFDMSLPDKDLGYAPHLLSVRLNGRQSKTLKRLFNGLHKGGYRRHNRQHVDKLGQVVTWLLDHVADQLGVK